MIYSCITKNIQVNVSPMFIKELSDSFYNTRYTWSYDISIKNNGPITIQIISRYWEVVSADGHIDKVHGAGIVGKKPIIKSGESFQYTSQVHLQTKSGFMSGIYYARSKEDDGNFPINIPAFSLDVPYELITIN